jgi:hypothetical protein
VPFDPGVYQAEVAGQAPLADPGAAAARAIGHLADILRTEGALP